MSWKFIKAVGLELEGGFKSKRTDLHQDDSLKHDQFSNSASIGELISEPIDTEEGYINWIKNAYTDFSENPPCAAFHIHVSFKHINYYSQCMSEDFCEKFLVAMKKWGEDYPIRNKYFWERLRGKNKYCVNEFRAYNQVKCTTKDEMRKDNLRRTVLNYCFGLHKTIENRLFPTFKTSHAAISATKGYLDFIESYLENNPISKDEILMEIVDEDEFHEPNFLKKTEDIITLKRFNLYSLNRKRNHGELVRHYGYDDNIVMDESPKKQIKKPKIPLYNNNPAAMLNKIVSNI